MNLAKITCRINNAFARMLLLMLCFVAVSAGAKVWTAKEFPMVHLQDARRYVCDPGRVLSPAVRDSVDLLLRNLESARGVQTVVAVADSIEGDDCYTFGMELARHNGVGSKRQNTGLVIVLSPASRCYYILTGHGLEGALPDAVCRRVENRYMVPHLKQGNWDRAVLDGVSALCAHLQNDATLLPETGGSAADDDDAKEVALVITIGLVIIAVAVYASKRKRSYVCPRCKRHSLKPTGETLQRTADGKIMEIYRCSHCGYTETREKRDDHDGTNRGGGAFLPPFIWFGGGGGGGNPFGGGGFSGGSFGGGSFGGGGSGGRF